MAASSLRQCSEVASRPASSVAKSNSIHVPEPQDPDGVTELARFGLRFGDHVVAQPRTPMFPSFPDSPFSGRPSGSSPPVEASRGFSHPAGRLYPAGAAVRASSRT
jgi:hypothetical protein